MAKKIKKEKNFHTTENEYESYRFMIANEEYENIMDLLVNSVKIKNIEKYVPEDIVKRWLFEFGIVATYKMGKGETIWAKCSGAGVDEYGRPTMYNLITENGKSWLVGRNSEDLGILYIRPNRHGVFEYLWQRCQELAYIRMCMQNNLIATENQIVYECNSLDSVTQMKAEFKKREIGMPVIFKGNIDKTYGDGVNTLGTNVPFIADKLLASYTNIRNEILENFGILAGNTDKKERVQVGEIQSQVGFVIDNIYKFIETFNLQAEEQNLPYRMELNSTVESLYANYKMGDGENEQANN